MNKVKLGSLVMVHTSIHLSHRLLSFVCLCLSAAMLLHLLSSMNILLGTAHLNLLTAYILPSKTPLHKTFHNHSYPQSSLLNKKLTNTFTPPSHSLVSFENLPSSFPLSYNLESFETLNILISNSYFFECCLLYLFLLGFVLYPWASHLLLK